MTKNEMKSLMYAETVEVMTEVKNLLRQRPDLTARQIYNILLADGKDFLSFDAIVQYIGYAYGAPNAVCGKVVRPEDRDAFCGYGHRDMASTARYVNIDDPSDTITVHRKKRVYSHR